VSEINIMANYDGIVWPNMVWQIWPIIGSMTIFGPNCSVIGQLCLIIVNYGKVWLVMIYYDQLWCNIGNYGYLYHRLWSVVAKYNKYSQYVIFSSIWSDTVMYSKVQSNIAKYDPACHIMFKYKYGMVWPNMAKNG